MTAIESEGTMEEANMPSTEDIQAFAGLGKRLECLLYIQGFTIKVG